MTLNPATSITIDRGPAPDHKANFSDDFELVAMRHMVFRRSPNPSNEQLRALQHVADKASWGFYKKNERTCTDHGLEIEDLKSYAMVWTCNYLGLCLTEGGDQTPNEQYLGQYLKQRFIEFHALLKKKSRNVLPMLDDAYIAMHGRPYEYTSKSEWYTSDPSEEPDESPEVSVAQRDRSKKEAVLDLNARLTTMPHDEMVQVLSGAVENDRLHPDARRTASRKLQVHAKKCSICATVELPRAPGDGSVPNNLPIQDEEGRVFGSAKEAAAAHGVYPSNVRAVLSGRYKHTGGHRFTYVQPTAG